MVRRVGVVINLTQGYHKLREEVQERMGHENDSLLEEHSMQVEPEPQWMSVVKEVKAVMREIDRGIAQIDSYKHHGSRFQIDSEEVQKKIEVASMDVTQNFRRCQRTIKVLGNLEGLSDQQMELKNNLQIDLATQLQGYSVKYRKIKKEHIEAMNEVQSADIRDGGFKKEQLQMVKKSAEEANQMSEELKKIHENIVEIAEMFNEMAILVVDQGTLLDRIDYNIEMTSRNVKGGVVELQKTENLTKKTNRKIILIILLLLILAGLMGVGIKIILKLVLPG